MQQVSVIDNRDLGGGYLLLTVESPYKPEEVRPGQFIMLRAPGRLDPLLPRAFALYDVRPPSNGGPAAMDLFYHVIGKMTAIMSELAPGDEVSVFGPLGNAFTLPRGLERAVLVAGGVGLAPMLLLARSIKESNQRRSKAAAVEPLLIYGGRTYEQIVCREDFEAEGCPVLVTTEDGSAGVRGLVTDALAELLEARSGGVEEMAVYACGPEGMLKAVAGLARRHDVPCQASLEARMACGFGICLGCVVKVLGARRGQPETNGGRYERVCMEGPIFDAREVSWDESAHY